MPIYKHNDYYGYINNIQQKAISNPQWFWSNSEDASQARQWLYNNGASAIVDDIYKNTPEEIQKTIPANYLSQNLQSTRYINDVRKRNENAGRTVTEVAAGVAGAPALLAGATVAPITTGMGLLGSAAGSIGGSMLGSRIGNAIYSRGTENDGGGSSISTNREKGATAGGLIVGTIGGITSGLTGNLSESILKSGGHYNPAETFSSAERQAARNEWSGYLDNIQKLKSRWRGAYKRTASEFGTKFEEAPGHSLNGIDPRVRLSERVPNILNPNETYNPIHISGQKAAGINNAVDAADAALKYYDKWGAFQNRDSFIKIDPAKNISNSSHSNNIITVGTSNKPYEIYDDGVSNKIYKLRIDEIIGHELGHENPRFNTGRPTVSLKSYNGETYNLPSYNSDSLYYGFDYSKINPVVKSTLKPKGKVNIHDKELSESFSDVFGLRTAMDVNGIGKENKYNVFDVLRYKYTVPGGRNNRFLMQHPGLRNQVRALNTSVYLKKGGNI